MTIKYILYQVLMIYLISSANCKILAQEPASKIFFDSYGMVTSEQNAYYYRVKSENINEYKSYFVNGETLYFEGKIIKPDLSDESKNVYINTCIWYYRNKQKKAVRNYNADGKEHGNSVYYYETGKVYKEIEYKDGKMVNNRYVEYDESGVSSRVFEDNFNDNTGGWDLYKSDKSSSEITKGGLSLTSFTDEGTSRYLSLPVTSRDFVIETEINIDKFSQHDKVGLIFGFKDWNNYNFFVISGSSFSIGTVFEGVTGMKVEGMYSGVINNKGSNNLKIIGIGDKNIYSVNGEIQYKSEKMRNYGSNAGFVIRGKSSVNVKKIILKELDFKSSGIDVATTDYDVKATGTGIIFSMNGYLLTNYHVIESANKILIEQNSGDIRKTYNAILVKKDVDNDLAVLKIQDESYKTQDSEIPYSFLQQGGMDVGATVFTIGFPYALSGMGKEAKFSDGKISSKTGYNDAINSYQTTIPVQPGNSGGPLFNEKGELVGIINAKFSAGDNVSYAVKLNYAKTLIDLLPDAVSLPSGHSIKSMTFEEKVKVISPYTVLIKIK